MTEARRAKPEIVSPAGSAEAAYAVYRRTEANATNWAAGAVDAADRAAATYWAAGAVDAADRAANAGGIVTYKKILGYGIELLEGQS